MRRSSTGIAAAVVMTALLLTGCTTLDQIVGTESWKEWAPEQTSLQVYGDGVVAETIFDHLDQAWYTGDELQDMIARSMNEYNAANGENSLNVTEYSDEGGDVMVRLVYRTAEDYARYNNVVFFSGSMLDAEMEGYLFSGPFSSVDDSGIKESGLDASEPLSHKEYRVVISDSGHVVQVPGVVRYISSNAEVVNSHVIKPAASSAAVETESAAADATGDPETGEGMSDKETDQTYLYIIYEKDQEADLLPSEMQSE